MADDVAKPEWIITLVHGTWGRGFFATDKQPFRGPRWFQEGSDFLTRFRGVLRESFPSFTIEPFKWSGSNSVLHRDLASRLLAEQLVEQRTRAPDAKRLVVGHSHGGNVALRAIEHLKGETHDIYLVTLATPFLEVFSPERRSVSKQKLAFVSLLGLLIFPLIHVLLTAVLPHSTNLIGPGILVAAVVMLLLLIALANYRDASGYGTRKLQAAPAEFVDKLSEATSHEAFARSNIPLLVIRGVDDEASLLIASAAISSRLSTLLNTTLYWAVAVFLSVPLLVGVPLLLTFIVKGMFSGVWGSLRSNAALDAYATAAGFTMLLLFLLIIFSMVFTLFTLSFGYAYGREFFMRFVDAEVSVNSTPDTPRKTTVYTIVRRTWATKRLRHYLYDDLSVPSIVVRWLLSESVYELRFFDDSRRRHPTLTEDERGHEEIPDVDEVRRRLKGGLDSVWLGGFR